MSDIQLVSDAGTIGGIMYVVRLALKLIVAIKALFSKKNGGLDA